MNAQSKIEPSLIGALAAALPELESAKKNKANPAFKSKYADLAAVIEAIEPVTKHGLWYRQHTHENQTAFGLATEDDDGNAAVKASQGRQSEPETISDAQWTALVQLVENTGTDAGKLCQAYNAASLKDFTAEQFNQAKAILEKRLKEKANA